MADVSAESSMEDILASIKRIISEEGESGAPRVRPAGRVAHGPQPQVEADSDDEVLELNDPMPGPTLRPTGFSPRPAFEPILSRETAEVTRTALNALSRLLVRPEPESDGTLEGLVRELLRPMLREWMDANLPQMVETLVAREIRKITGSVG